MNTKPSRVLATVRSAAVLFAFAMLAAVGFASARVISPVARTTAPTPAAQVKTVACHPSLTSAPAAAPISTVAFRR